MTNAIIGNWKLLSSENFDELMKALGVGLLMRKQGNTTKVYVMITQNGSDWTMTTTSALKTLVVNFQLDQEVDETTIDGRQVKTTFCWDGPKLVQTQKDKDGKVVCTITNQLTESGELHAVARAGDVTAVRVYHKEQ